MVTSKDKGDLSEKKLDTILDAVKVLTNQVNILEKRISLLEGSFDQSKPQFSLPDPFDPDSTPQVDFDDKDEMLQRAYSVLRNAPQPLTTQEVADQIGRSRSTTSQYLNELHSRNLILKSHGTTPDKSRNIVFSPVSSDEES